MKTTPKPTPTDRARQEFYEAILQDIQRDRQTLDALETNLRAYMARSPITMAPAPASAPAPAPPAAAPLINTPLQRGGPRRSTRPPAVSTASPKKQPHTRGHAAALLTIARDIAGPDFGPDEILKAAPSYSRIQVCKTFAYLTTMGQLRRVGLGRYALTSSPPAPLPPCASALEKAPNSPPSRQAAEPPRNPEPRTQNPEPRTAKITFGDFIGIVRSNIPETPFTAAEFKLQLLTKEPGLAALSEEAWWKSALSQLVDRLELEYEVPPAPGITAIYKKAA